MSGGRERDHGTSSLTEPLETADEAQELPEECGAPMPSDEPLVGYRLTVSYLGTPYSGWQTQPGKETVQGHLERAVAKIFGLNTSVQGSGRTDAGVHALAQVASFRAPRRHTAEILQRALNNNMPETIRIIDAQIVEPEFHARFDSAGKTYHYHILNSPLADPFRQGLCFHVPRPLDVAAMRAAAAFLPGIHDFSSFASNPGYTRTTMVRTMHCVELDVVAEQTHPYGTAREIVLRVTADGFLYRMVRNIVGALIKVGHGRMTPPDFQRVLQAARRTAAPNTAPPHGLYMARAYYGDELRLAIEGKQQERERLRSALPSGAAEPSQGPMLWEGSAACFAAAAAGGGAPVSPDAAEEGEGEGQPVAHVAPVKFGGTRRPRRAT